MYTHISRKNTFSCTRCYRKGKMQPNFDVCTPMMNIHRSYTHLPISINWVFKARICKRLYWLPFRYINNAGHWIHVYFQNVLLMVIIQCQKVNSVINIKCHLHFRVALIRVFYCNHLKLNLLIYTLLFMWKTSRLLGIDFIIVQIERIPNQAYFNSWYI